MKTTFFFLLIAATLILTGCGHYYGRHHYYGHGMVYDSTGTNQVTGAIVTNTAYDNDYAR